jgi:hypothetical protein
MGLFDFFKTNKDDTQPQTGLHLQNELIEAIVMALQPFKLLKHDIVGLKIHLVPDSQKQVYDTLLGGADFKTNLQRNLESNDFDLPNSFSFGYQWCNLLPENCPSLGANKVLEIVRRSDSNQQQPTQTATITVLRGQLAQNQYQLQPDETRYNIGRSQNPMLDTGRLHSNQIVAIAADEAGFDPIKGKPNLLVSRAHAYILYDGFRHQYCLYAYAGGLNIGQNSSKIFRGVDETIRLLIENHPYPLANNDQIELGGREGILLKFNLN